MGGVQGSHILPPPASAGPRRVAAYTRARALASSGGTLPSASLESLRGPLGISPARGVVATLLISLLTFGLGPALWWGEWLRRLIEAERAQFHEVSVWVAAHGTHAEAHRLGIAAGRVRFRAGLAGLAVLLSLAVGLTLAMGLYFHLTRDVFAVTYRFHPSRASSGAWWFYLTWTIGLSVAYFCHWLQLHLHARDVRRFLYDFSRVVMHDGLAPVFMEPVGLGLRPFWLVGAIAMIGVGAPWGIVVMAAGAINRRYSRRTGPLARAAIAAQVQQLLAASGRRTQAATTAEVNVAPTLEAVPHLPSHGATLRRCERARCRHFLPASARFCPRCGRRTVAKIDRMA